jgi:secondary thiamine-phosphate synthase enzyme
VHLELTVHTAEREQFINITGQLNELLAKSGVKDGCCTVFVSHTTAALTVNEDADQDVMEDLLNFLQKMVPFNNSYRHREGNSDAHIKASLLGCSLHLIIKDGYFDLGTWQGVFLAEFDGPRSRTVKVWID